MKSTIEELTAFVSIVDSGSIVKAAQQLDQTTSGVSRALQRLESKLNVTLLERTTRKLKLTYEGQQFLTKARKILLDLTEAEESLQNNDAEASGLIRIDSATPFVLHVIVPLIEEFMQRYPKIDIEITNHDQVIDLLEHKTDVAIRFGELADSSLHAKLLCKSRLYIVASPVYAQKHGLPKNAAELSSHTLLGFSQPAHLNTWPIQLEDEPLTIQAKIKCSNGETVRQLALQGAGIACLSRFMVEQDIQDGRFIALLEDQIQIKEQKIHAVYYQQNYVPKRIRLFIDFLAEKLKAYL
ncbi:MAG: LysR family transcriptional regulator [Pseudomonadales bacterium RIFCSPHIGHO2_12_FULL_40_16]|jgi:DNA-binding transcriptional LysR family regulator|uniref:LysR family transcriptional regulator n=1 Tax=Acinetobacter johnsonii TaxID=40214 RepID=A0A3S9AL89_ACIJO|nr:LysR family transcriptional regulator [Acinetobacter johnsonii]OHC21438.1 MAG: LysR family transcriptional regulator [Pseudomonadales bacterium RIFCSPHIGHO2_12_FULL_40_16]AZN64397.1 LysR family transcriptional regulator [Acinetobacter johnsonii]MCF7642026.1 LysR family transcriptional regulator [Acinetobacter johnsonii]QQV09341.1 LysR family transcriptional regulator [Acinetobacter johnsonii]HRB83173.1 LysR family transcriptional regulator [Acinetobacter johnsonii]